MISIVTVIVATTCSINIIINIINIIIIQEKGGTRGAGRCEKKF